MRKILSLVLVILCGSFFALAQPKNPVKFSYSTKKISDCEYELIFTASIENTWHMYSQIPPLDEGPLPTVFNFEKSSLYSLVGKTSEPKPIEMAEPVFDNAVVRYFEKQAVFKQKIKTLADGSITIKGTIEGMTCNESMCIPFSPPFDFEFKITGAKKCPDSKTGNETGNNKVDGTDCVCDTAAIIASVNSNTTTQDTSATDSASVNNTSHSNNIISETKTDTKDMSWLVIFLTGFVLGFTALLTPCVFPMIPMTVSFFIKQSKTKAQGVSNALIYSASIVVLYVSLGLLVTLLFGDDALNALSTNVWFNIFFFLLLLIFAVSFFGAFEITLPASFVNKIDRASDKGGLLGIFFMAFTLSLVSFSCTGPIIGTLLVEAASTGSIVGPFWGMFGFSLALALPFGLFAAFPGWLNSLPKSGGWLNTVKVFLGFLELAFAFKFLSNADLVVQTGLLTREIFLALWIVIFAMLGAYLMGWFKLSHDSDVKHLSVLRLSIAMLSFAFTVYMIPGMWGAPVKLLSGVIPPSTYTESPQGFGGGGNSSSENTLPEHAHLGPNGIPLFDNYEYAMEYAKKVKKPLMLDFTGWACANCRRMEDNVWTEPEIKRRLSNDVVLVSLYVDDKRALPKEQQIEVEWNGKRTLKTIGNKWSYLQSTKFKAIAQPQYWIVDYSGEPVIESSDYMKGKDWNVYAGWIDRGVAEFKKKNK